MKIWDRKRYEDEKVRFIQQRVNLAPLWGHLTLVFAVSWGAAWIASWAIRHFLGDFYSWANSLPIRYALAFVIAYLCFFLAIRVWINVVRREPHQQGNTIDLNGLDFAGDGEGCVIVVAVLLISFIVSGLLFLVGGAPLLLEAAFEAAFSGVIVRRLAGEFKLGDWKKRLFLNTWKQALISAVLLVALVAWIQKQSPDATTFAEAIRSMTTSRSY